MNIRPLQDRVLVRRSEGEDKSAGGIVIPDSAKDKSVFGEIISVGDGKVLENGQVRGVSVKKGDKVLYGKYAGTEVKIKGEDLLVLKEDDIMCVIED